MLLQDILHMSTACIKYLLGLGDMRSVGICSSINGCIKNKKQVEQIIFFLSVKGSEFKLFTRKLYQEARREKNSLV